MMGDPDFVIHGVDWGLDGAEGATEAHPLDAVDELDEGSDALVEGGVGDGLADGIEEELGLVDHGGDEGLEGVLTPRRSLDCMGILTPRRSLDCMGVLTPRRSLHAMERGSGCEMIRMIRMRIRFFARILIAQPTVQGRGTDAALFSGESDAAAIEHEVIEDAAFFRFGMVARHG